MRPSRPRAAAVVAFGAALVLSPALPASAASAASAASSASAGGYRYWSFWERDGGSWTYATQGPSTARPADGDIQGFRFSVSENTRDSAKPRGAAEFASICSGTQAKGGAKRVAFVLDFGTGRDAVNGQQPPKTRTVCARVPQDATSGEALASVAKPLRYNSAALLCAIAGYPKTGCGEQVPGGSPSRTERSAQPNPGSGPAAGAGGSGQDGGPSAGLIAGMAAVITLGSAAVWQSRRRRG